MSKNKGLKVITLGTIVGFIIGLVPTYMALNAGLINRAAVPYVVFSFCLVSILIDAIVIKIKNNKAKKEGMFIMLSPNEWKEN